MFKTAFRLTCLWSILLAATAGAQTIPEIARKKPSNPIVRGVLRDISPKPIEELAKSAELILEGTLVKRKSYLTADQENVLTDYEVVAPKLIAGTVPSVTATPGRSQSVIVTVYGGEVTIDGVPVRIVDYNIADIKSNGRFLLFLRRFGSDPGHYQIDNGGAFEIQGGRLRALLARSEGAYKELSERPYEEVLGVVQATARAAK